MDTLPGTTKQTLYKNWWTFQEQWAKRSIGPIVWRAYFSILIWTGIQFLKASQHNVIWGLSPLTKRLLEWQLCTQPLTTNFRYINQMVSRACTRIPKYKRILSDKFRLSFSRADSHPASNQCFQLQAASGSQIIVCAPRSTDIDLGDIKARIYIIGQNQQWLPLPPGIQGAFISPGKATVLSAHCSTTLTPFVRMSNDYH